MTSGVRRARRLLEQELLSQELHMAEFQRVIGAAAHLTGLKLNLGCGANLKAGWCNIDLSSRDADYHLDLREMWPFSDGSAKIVYSEHFFEHLERPRETRLYLQEALRVLEVGGTMHIGVPSTRWVMKAYGDSRNAYWRMSARVWHPQDCFTEMEHVNFHFRQGGEHKYSWDAETLLRDIVANGFMHPAVRRWRAEWDSPKRRIGTLYVVARKA